VYSLASGAILGYLLGSVPSAFLLVRWKSRIDIRNAGSGNVGTLNSFQVSGSKRVAVAVLCLDFLKGVASVLLAGKFFANDFAVEAISGIFAVVGHNFPVWLKFRGGRGLATAAGVFAFLSPAALPLWGGFWLLIFALARIVNVANAGATGLLILALWLLPAEILQGFLPEGATTPAFCLFGTIILLVILVRHIAPVVQWAKNHK